MLSGIRCSKFTGCLESIWWIETSPRQDELSRNTHTQKEENGLSLTPLNEKYRKRFAFVPRDHGTSLIGLLTTSSQLRTASA